MTKVRKKITKHDGEIPVSMHLRVEMLPLACKFCTADLQIDPNINNNT